MRTGQKLYDAKSTYLIVHKALEYALEVSLNDIATKKTQVEFGPVNENNNCQLWLIEQVKGGCYELVNGFTDDVLTEEDGNLVVKRGTASSHQIWKLIFTTQNEVIIKLASSKHNKGLVIRDGKIALEQSKTERQGDIWRLIKVVNNQNLKTSCFIRSTDTSLLIDIPNCSKKEGEQIIIYEPNYRYNQRWNIYRAGEVYIIKSYSNQLNLEIEDINESKEKIIQESSNGGLNQFWRFEKMSQNQNIFRIFCWYDPQIQLGHKHHKLIAYHGKKYKWEIEGYFPK